MGFLTLKRRNGPELLDLPEEQGDAEEFARGLEEIAVTNRLLGGAHAVLAHLNNLLPPPGETLSVLDIATGSADIQVEISKWARENGLNVRIAALDINPKVIAAARERTKGLPEIAMLVADGLNPPFKDRTFHLTVCALTVHHLSEADTERFLKVLARLSKRFVVVSDLRRSWVSYTLFYLLTRIFTKNRFTRHDGPLSILRAYTPEELLGIAHRAGLTGARVVKHGFWRMTLIYEEGSGG